MQAWKIRYLSRDDRGVAQTLTGMVIAPREAILRTPRRVLAWAHGTWGTADQCTPSISPRFFAATPALEAVRQGFVVVAPDYPGLGVPGPHAYLVGTVTGRSVIDAVRAARAIPGTASGSAYAVWGESQGGHAVLWTGQMQAAESAGLQLVGVAAGAPPTDLPANLRGASNATYRAFLTAMTVDSWSQYYRVPLKIGRARTPGIIRRLARNCITVDSGPKIGAMLGILALRQDFEKSRSWRHSAVVVVRRGQQHQPRQPGSGSVRADARGSAGCAGSDAGLRAADVQQRVRVKWIDLPGKDHATTAKQSAAATLQWIDGRFAGVQAPSDCGRF
jgi:acetyl esterase/lipase